MGYRLRGALPTTPSKKISKRADYTGQRFNRLVAVECLGLYREGFRLWGCVCDCGKKVAVRSRELLNNNTQSCGCLNLERIRELGGYNRKDVGESAFNQLFYNYKKSARARGYEFSLDVDIFKNLVESPCFYCGDQRMTKAARAKGSNGDYFYTGVDRVKNSIGYTIENSKPCCKQCNIAKGVLGEGKFYDWILRVYNNLAKSARFEFGENG